jgi:hypothetical protein
MKQVPQEVPQDNVQNKNRTTIGFYVQAGHSYADAKRLAKEATEANQASLAAARARYQAGMKQASGRCESEGAVDDSPVRRSHDYDLD